MEKQQSGKSTQFVKSKKKSRFLDKYKERMDSIKASDEKNKKKKGNQLLGGRATSKKATETTTKRTNATEALKQRTKSSMNTTTRNSILGAIDENK